MKPSTHNNLRYRQPLSTAVKAAGIAVLILQPLHAITWIGVNATWTDGGSTANWSPADEPDSNDAVIFNTANAVALGSNNAILSLDMSGGIDLSTSGFDLTVDGLVLLADASTNLIIDDAAGSVNADDATINTGGTIELKGGSLVLDQEAGTSLLNIGGGSLTGNGILSFLDAPVSSTTMLINDGTITALSRPSQIFFPPPVGTLQINSANSNARVDLDGNGGGGVVNVNRNQTLDINVPIFDPIGGSINLYQNTTFDSTSAWAIDVGTITVDNGFVDSLPQIVAEPATITGGTLTQNGGAINVSDTDGELRFGSVFTMNGGSFANNGLVVFNNNATIGAGAAFTMPTNNSSITVGAGRTVTFNQANFNPDGGGAATNKLTIGDGGVLSLNLGALADDDISSLVRIEGGELDVTSTAGSWSIDGDIEIPTGFTASVISGDPLTLTNVGVTISGTGILNLNANTTFGSAATFSGNGELAISKSLDMTASTVINMTGGTVDLDGTDSVGDFINIDAPLTINAATMRSFGKANGGGGINTLDVNNSVGTGVLTVNLDNAASEWTLNGNGNMNLVNDNAPATLLAGSDANLLGIVNVTGDVRSTARLDIFGAVHILTAAEPFRIDGGNGDDDPNWLYDGTIDGAGVLNAATTSALHGRGVINCTIDFDGSAKLRADTSMLTINGTILDVGTIGTAGPNGTLNVVNAWNNNVSSMVQLMGGVLTGGTITNDSVNGIQGEGLVSARVINNSQLISTTSGTLVFETVANDNDWDGAGGTGQLKATAGTLELRDTGAASAFTGSVTASTGAMVFANGFAFDFNPGSSITLNGGTYKATSSTDIGGAMTVGVQHGLLEVQNNFFLTFESTSVTTLNGNLTLKNNNIGIDAGATFSGNGSLIIPEGSFSTAEANANINVLVDLQGVLRPGNSEGIARVDVRDYQQSDTGELFVELTGTGLNQFDRIVVNGTALIDGYLNIDIDGGFVPVAGNTFVILSASGGVFGKFDYFDVSGLPPGISFKVNYLATAVQLEIVTGSPYDQWINSFLSLVNPADKLKTADPDGDGLSNEGEFALDGDPTSGKSSGKIVGKIAPVAGVNAFTLTFPMRSGSFSTEGQLGADPPGGPLSIFRPDDTLVMYTIKASDDLITYPLDVDEVTGPDATAIQTGLPPLNFGWTYRTFRSPGPVEGDPKEFMRVLITQWPNVP